MLTLLNKITKLYSIKLLTRGRGIKEVQKYADVICENPLMYLNIIEEQGPRWQGVRGVHGPPTFWETK